MTLIIDLPPQTEAWLESEALRRGMPPADLVTSVLNERASQAPGNGAAPATPQIDAKNAAAIALLNRWIAEDATDDPEEIRKAEEEVEEFKRNMNANRAATRERLVFP